MTFEVTGKTIDFIILYFIKFICGADIGGSHAQRLSSAKGNVYCMYLHV